MSSAISRLLPVTTFLEATIKVLKIVFRVLAIGLAILTGLGIVFLVWFIPYHNYDNNVLRIAKMHHYKHGESAFCNSTHDSNNNGTGGDDWLPCTVLSQDDPQYKQYFVSYGSTKANIEVIYMRQN